ncbi:TPA: hypothetical protein GND40_003666 [Salmonella enterica subsp. indica]|uniref:HTH luxR-type domain-containing protein n=3 Tax=Salmonella enterica TaxID=28901 RepID=A0A701YVP1_SALER|nr:hypothetical protein [Salmonella enterica subsp. indica]EEM2503379.1 hypothetical protein [Salmonella enterica subsp. indica serovar 45:a:e,n,x]HAC6565163.1 hypothetical protein [Salmonella enterica subsp. indica]HAE8103559.1 hypothetical protein [Salmonella enterica subsp. indica serovar 45:a:e,n,x]HAF7947678.1 hypothetical protein [Salmonella enterica subsp. indica]
MRRAKMNNPDKNKCIIVYSRHWSETFTIQGMYTLISPDTRVITCFSPDRLVESLSVYSTAPVILGILPHESIFLLSRLSPYLQQRHILLFGDEFNFVDRMAPFYFFKGDITFHAWKDKTIMKTRTILYDFLINKPLNRVPIQHIPVQPGVPDKDELIYHVNIYLCQMFLHHGVGENAGKVLLMLAYGFSTKEIARELGICTKTVSVYKYNGLALLGMETGSFNIYRGIIVRPVLQKYNYGEKSVKTGCSYNEKEINKSVIFHKEINPITFPLSSNIAENDKI